MQLSRNKILIGRSDKADFPEIELDNIDIKIDSGAYTSSIHCYEVNEVKEGNSTFLKLKFLDNSHPQYNKKDFIFDEYSSKIVKSSSGIKETRFRIHTKITIFNQTFPIYLTLSERKDMKFPILLGRKFLNKKFVIDTAKKNLSHKLKYKNKWEL